MVAHARGLENVNRVDDLVGFLRRWEHRDELKCKELRFAVADGGNINLHGTPDCSESLLLTRWHPSFTACVEVGVCQLVIRLVTEWDCVSYSSCEGHRSSIYVPARVRHVRLLSRSREEHLRLERMLGRLVDITNVDVDDWGVLLACKHSTVVSDDGLEAPGLDLIFEPQAQDEHLYWKLLEASYQRCLLHIDTVNDEVGGIDWTECADAGSLRIESPLT